MPGPPGEEGGLQEPLPKPLPESEPGSEPGGDGAGFPPATFPSTTKERIVTAALETLKDEGFAGTSARAIARRGNFNQALIFYHFGTLNDLLLAALDRTSAERMARYREAVRTPGSVEDRIRTAAELYREDLRTGHITVISELIAGSLARPDLGPEVVARMEPWVELVEEVLADMLAESPFGGVIQPRPVAFGIIALYLGVDLLSHLDHDRTRAEALFETAGRLAPLLAPVMGDLGLPVPGAGGLRSASGPVRL